MSNLCFIGWNYHVMHQYIIHFTIISSMICYITLPMPSFNYGDVVLVLISLSMRCLIITVRYGLMPDARYKRIHEQIDINYARADFIYFGWVRFDQKSLKHEIQTTKLRWEIDEDEFTFSFAERLSDDLRQKLTVNEYEDCDIGGQDQASDHGFEIVHKQSEGTDIRKEERIQIDDLEHQSKPSSFSGKNLCLRHPFNQILLRFWRNQNWPGKWINTIGKQSWLKVSKITSMLLIKVIHF